VRTRVVSKLCRIHINSRPGDLGEVLVEFVR
jgi:hypothetical protein